MIGNLLPFLMFGILAAALLARPLSRQSLVSMPVALILLGFFSSEIWVWLGQDTGLRWEILRDLVFYLLLPILIFEAAVNINVQQLRSEGLLVFSLAVPLLMVATLLSAMVIQSLVGGLLGHTWALAFLCGSMISATDPTTAGAILNGSDSSDRVVSILRGESLVNDATTITLFIMISSLLTIPGYDLNWLEFAGRFSLVLAGSVLVGLFLGWLFDRINSGACFCKFLGLGTCPRLVRRGCNAVGWPDDCLAAA
jgi:CPA1 family monovalent cation:H+ antiporter